MTYAASAGCASRSRLRRVAKHGVVFSTMTAVHSPLSSGVEVVDKDG